MIVVFVGIVGLLFIGFGDSCLHCIDLYIHLPGNLALDIYCRVGIIQTLGLWSLRLVWGFTCLPGWCGFRFSVLRFGLSGVCFEFLGLIGWFGFLVLDFGVPVTLFCGWYCGFELMRLCVGFWFGFVNFVFRF